MHRLSTIRRILFAKILSPFYYFLMRGYDREDVFVENSPIKFPKTADMFFPHVAFPTEINKSRSRNGMRQVYLFYKVLYDTIQKFPGFFSDIEPVSIVWSGKQSHFSKTDKTLIAEHGWLPRSTYQISMQGSNCEGAPMKSLSPEDYIALVGGRNLILAATKNVVGKRTFVEVDDPCLALGGRDKGYYIAPLQVGDDLNLKFSESVFAKYYGAKNATENFNRAFIDYVENKSPQFPVVFTQHPVDGVERNYKPVSGIFLPNSSKVKSIHLIRDPRCLGVISVNSNVIHEALALNVPCCVLGRIFWNSQESSPFEKDLEQFFKGKGEAPFDNVNQLGYLAKLLCYQWNLSDLQNPYFLKALLTETDHVIPAALRKKYGYFI